MENLRIFLQDAERLFDGLADANRLRILMLLRQHDLFVCELARLLDMPQPTTSNHLSVLRRVGLVYSMAQGRWRLYTLGRVPDQISHLLAALRYDPVVMADARRLEHYLSAGRDICGTKLEKEETS